VKYRRVGMGKFFTTPRKKGENLSPTREGSGQLLGSRERFPGNETEKGTSGIGGGMKRKPV